MVFTNHDLLERLAALREQSKKASEVIDQEFQGHFDWLLSVCEGVKNGTINVKSVLVPKTPGKQKAPLFAIRESLQSTVDLDEVPSVQVSTQNKRISRKGARRGEIKKATNKSKNIHISEEDVQIIRPLKRLSEDTIDLASKRLCGNRISETTSRDSGLSSVGSCNTHGGSSVGATVKVEVLTPKNSSLESTASVDKNGHSFTEDLSANLTTTLAADPPETHSPAKKRSKSAGHGTFVVKEEPRRSSQCVPEPTLSPDRRSSIANDRTLILAPAATSELSPLVSPPQTKPQSKALRSPIVKAPPAHLLKGESVKKAVKAFEALNEDHEMATISHMAPPTLPPPSKLPASSQTDRSIPREASSSVSSLDDALNAPTRVTRTKTRAMAKAAAAEEMKFNKVDSPASAASKILKSPVGQQLHKPLPMKSVEKRVEDNQEKENSAFTASKIVMKPFGSASKQPQFFFKPSTPLNRMNPAALNNSVSTSFSVPRNNIVTSVESFITKPVVIQEVKLSREENLQKLVAKAAKADIASKKREEFLKAQMEEKIKRREEKRLKVCAAREAMEKEKLEMQQKLEREREEKQKLLQAEREEKLRQEHLKKKKLAMQKAAETEERRRQEEQARLAKLKQQEEEQRRIAAQRKKEQEDAERKQMERLQQEREAAALRAQEAERLAKEATLKAKKTSKVQLDQTYDKLSPAHLSYGMTPGPEDREPMLLSNPDNYGIDDANTDDSSEDESKPKKVVPKWAQSKYRMPKLFDDYEITHPQMFVFFGSKKSTPDLSKIFTSIDRRQLIRKSSAVWRTPPVKN